MLEIIEQGGNIVWVILVLGLVAFGVFLERAVHLHRARIRIEDFLKGIFNILRRGNIVEALSICDETPGPVAHIVRTAILHRKDPKDAVRSIVEKASLAEVSRMERRLVVIATVAQVAPLLGLLGTALGMAETLIVMKGYGSLINFVDVSDGLIKALISTAAGLTVAIPCYVAFNLLVIKIDRIVLDMEKAASEIVAFLATLGSSHGETEDVV
ncbi:MAG: MotA/TolQ/ExbB proton channel family protein [Kiritimatiellae bacterium]|nr:MotA/TolQ/ExbB proton channel family protein [Kiritimatiellia bacterium]